ncbi:hypothetical protein PENTCL1PPCAC_27185 [Pristionchus entomophagus]|uniref:Uncharacterized protein n=1 Tax=Pristionchus entomophagus TaxID=358040 RepID=A0AAV5UDG4_9BILA|nr:hypothetical protein PENTCL1PPCAC_27185 [Pristionchus entomophagus]
MEEEFMALNFVKNNPFFKRDAEKRMSASFCGSMSLVSETVMVSDPGSAIRRPLASGYRGIGIISSSRSKSAFSLVESQPDTMVVEGTTVKLRRTDSTRRKEMAARRETVEILMEEIFRENRKSAAEIEAEERAASSGSDLEYGPGIVERLKAKFGRISTDGRKRKNHKRHHSVDDILEESVGGQYGSYDRRQSRQLTVPERSTQTLDRSPRHSIGREQLSRRASRSMADLGRDHYGERRSFSLQRPSRREEYERQQEEERLGHRQSIEEDDMVDIRELRKMFDRPAQGGNAAPAPWKSDAHRERFIERGRTHQTVPPNLGDSRRDAPPPRELRLSAPSAPISIDHETEGESTNRAVSLKKTIRRVSEKDERPVFDEETDNVPEFVKMARRLRRAAVDERGGGGGGGRKEEETPPSSQPLAILTTAPADPAPPSDTLLVSPPTGRRDSFTGAASDVSPPPEEPKPPMRPPLESDLSSNLSDAGSRYSSLARSEKSDRSMTESTHVPYSDLSLPRSDFSVASKASKRSVSTEGGVRIGYSRSTSSERKSNTYARIVPENQEASGVEEMQRLLNKFSSRKPREEEKEKEAPRVDAVLLAAREASARRDKTGGGEGEGRDRPPTVVMSPEPERRTRFVPTVVGIRSSDGRQLLSPTMTTSGSASMATELLQAAAPAANVVSISVRESAPSVIYTNHRSGSYDLLQQPQPATRQLQQRQPCDEDESDVRRSSVGSTASSTVSTSSIAESMTSSGCSSSEDLASTEDRPPRSLVPPITPPRKESLESSSPRKSLSARYLEERGREITVAPPPIEDESMLLMERSYGEMSFDRLASAYSTKPYGDEACTPPPTAAARPIASATWAPIAAAATTPKVEDEAAEAACCIQLPDTEHASSSAKEELTHKECDVTIVEIEEEEIIEEDEEVAPQVRQQSISEDNVTTPNVRQEEETDSEIDTDDDGEIEDIASRHLRLCLEDMNSPLMAGDGNPIRHSLIHLAMEEDRPALLEAMSETYSFVFEDLDEEAASSSNGIIKPPHKERCAKMKRISIASEVAGVYTYLDEQSAESEEEWREGAAVTIEDYHSMVAAAAAEAEAIYMRNMDELARWNASVAAAEKAGSSSSDPMSDLTSRHLVFST